ncbi:hypothetical protein HNY73_007181 [Argiope bruennichi]|uniref:Uncharacterized protein n=1 Tax=Argiope bruennichi TaxID=94029 RepID=A0A8T0FDN4_ARGBR|nr:hypothetical protein HNY73_007181 [Argiope bruennichi]
MELFGKKKEASHILEENHSAATLQFPEINGTEKLDLGYNPLPSKEDCYSSEESPRFDHCLYEVKNQNDPNRLPQTMPTVRCLHNRDVISKKLRARECTHCEEVKLQVPVLRKKNDGEGGDSYAVAFETTTVACIRTVRTSRIRSKTGHRTTFESPL